MPLATSTVVPPCHLRYDSGMLIEVQSGVQQAAPGRALKSTIILFSLACGLAIGMVWGRTGAMLDLRVAPSGWGLSFQPPRGWGAFHIPDRPGVRIRHFRGLLRDQVPAFLTLHLIEIDPEMDLASLAVDIEDQIRAQHDIDRFPSEYVRQSALLGSRDAVQIVNTMLPIEIRAARLENGHALVVSLFVHQSHLEPSVRRLFDLTCRSVEFQRP